jgi:ankyrin repeat protein
MVQDAKGQTAMHLACIEGELEGYKAIGSYNY